MGHLRKPCEKTHLGWRWCDDVAAMNSTGDITIKQSNPAEKSDANFDYGNETQKLLEV